MKLLPIITAALLTTASFATLAASEISASEANRSNLQSMGTIQVSNITGSPDDALSALQQKAMEEGASHYRVIGIDTPSDSSQQRANAEIYR
ncbi:YdgH/BhsA/McbA-like domain containing protein [Nissabacter sp. SGAir0207]|uniref:YdgH/BhsA/McbA-like domain containing protein n=1 Tax=Nissabacter sp. SGAir0207 TaxID=2126321 RepID=UPI0010CCC157|nr:YdgH/BhsA/McbA-like domain containing protein [Nissabacter sp. SGAir0207]QCR36951.1 DUF1471 domain-containing protein [Nissabacter sp. SGAir0207]